MRNILFTLLLPSFAAIFFSCSTDTTEIKVRISDSEYLHKKYPVWFAANEGIDKDSINEDMRASLRSELTEKKEEAVKIIEKRIIAAAEAPSGISALFSKTKILCKPGDTDEWVFTINRKTDPVKLTKLLEKNMECGFWETYNTEEIWDRIMGVNSWLSDPLVSAKLGIEPDTSEFGRENPLFRFLYPMMSNDGKLIEGCAVGNSRISDTATVNRILSAAAVQSALPYDLMLMWSLKPYPGSSDFYSLIAVKCSSRDREPLLTQENIVGASVDSKMYPPAVNIEMNSEGAAIWSRITAENIGRCIALTVNDLVYFYPRVANEVKGGKTTITADFTSEEAEEMAILLDTGSLSGMNVSVSGII